MNEKYEHILTLLDAQITTAKRNLAQFKRDGWTECAEEEQEHLTEWELLYDAVDQGLLDAAKADFGAVLLAIAGVPA